MTYTNSSTGQPECMTNFCTGTPGHLDTDYCDACIEDFRR